MTRPSPTRSDLPLVAHRGDVARFPENTLLSLRGALEAGAPAVEFDVQLTADGVPVLLHDVDLARTGGREERILDLTLAELADVEVNEADRLGEAFRGVRIPRLEEIVAMLAHWPEAHAFVELKRSSLRHFGRDRVLEAVAETIAPIAARCSIVSFDFEVLASARARYGHTIGGVIPSWTLDARHDVEQLAPEFVFVDIEHWPDDSAPWPGEWRWVVYGVECPDLAAMVLRAGAHLVETKTIATFVEHPAFAAVNER